MRAIAPVVIMFALIGPVTPAAEAQSRAAQPRATQAVTHVRVFEGPN